MAKVYLDVECFCGSVTKVFFRKPDHYTPTTKAFTCSGCDSKLQGLFKKKKGHSVSVEKRVIDPSKDLKSIMDEEVEKIIAEQDAVK